MMKNKKITTIFVLSQWIIPILIMGLLYLSEYNINPTKDMENKKCFIESILFLDDCYNIKTTNTSQNVDVETYTIPLYNDYNKEDVTLQISNTQVNEIISKIQNLVFSAMNDTSTISSNTTFYNTSEFIDITNYLELDTYTKDMKQNKNTENEFNLINVENNTNLQNNIQLNNYTDENNEGSLITNLLNDTLKEKIYNDEINTNTTEKLNFKRSPARPSTSKQDSQCLNANLRPQKPMDFNKLEIHEENFNKKLNEIYKDNKHSISFDETKIQLNMNQLNQYAINTIQLFDNINMSLLSGILLWTPLFFECLIKVFTVLYIPEWLLIITYLVGIAFNTIRNVFNLKMIKLQEKNMNATKTN
ncbi:unnamed protein product, partial [Heterotrigona itama]